MAPEAPRRAARQGPRSAARRAPGAPKCCGCRMAGDPGPRARSRPRPPCIAGPSRAGRRPAPRPRLLSVPACRWRGGGRADAGDPGAHRPRPLRRCSRPSRCRPRARRSGQGDRAERRHRPGAPRRPERGSARRSPCAPCAPGKRRAPFPSPGRSCQPCPPPFFRSEARQPPTAPHPAAHPAPPRPRTRPRLCISLVRKYPRRRHEISLRNRGAKGCPARSSPRATPAPALPCPAGAGRAGGGKGPWGQEMRQGGRGPGDARPRTRAPTPKLRDAGAPTPGRRATGRKAGSAASVGRAGGAMGGRC